MKTKKEMANLFKPRKGGCKTLLRFFFSHIGLLIIVAVYSVAGAFLLINIESDAETERILMKKMASNQLHDTREYIINHAWYHSAQNHNEKEFKIMVRKNLDLYHKFIVKSAQNSYYDGKPDEWNYDWTFSKSLLFTVTTMGAIGYGHIAPKTNLGQFFTIYYGMIGIPLLLLFLANIGNFLAKFFKYFYSRLCCRWCRIRHAVSELHPTKSLKPKILWKENIGTEKYMPTNDVDVPIVVNLCVIALYLILGGALFSSWENWQMYEAVYFTFITLTTIGFGDYVPGNAFSSNGNHAFISSIKMTVTMCFCLFGMALVSMAINLMQEQLVTKARWFATEIGISDSDKDAGIKYTVKRHDPEFLRTTPHDKDGNQTLTAKTGIKNIKTDNDYHLA